MSFRDRSYFEWEAKNIIAVSALEFDASENKEIIREGTYEGAVTKTTDIWKNQVNLSAALNDAKAGTDVLLLAGDNYDYSLHYESNSETVWIIASATAEVPSEENVESSNEHPGDVPDDAPTGILPDLDKCSAGELEGICSDIVELLEVSEVEKFTVPAGTWIVGKNISSGVYSIKSTGKSSSVYCSIKSSRWGDSAILISSETASGSLRHISLIDGDEIEISYKEVVFSREASYPKFQTAEKTGKSYDLSDYPQKELQNVYQTAIQKLSGQTFSDIVLSGEIWIVGKDIPSGRYDIKAYVKEGHGNYSFQVYNNEKNSSESGLSQISMFGYGNDVSTNASNIELKEGAVVVADGCMLKLSHADEDVFFG